MPTHLPFATLRHAGWTERLVLFLRVMAIGSILKGLYHWATVCGLIGDQGGFEAHTQAWQATTVFFSVIDLGGAVGRRRLAHVHGDDDHDPALLRSGLWHPNLRCRRGATGDSRLSRPVAPGSAGEPAVMGVGEVSQAPVIISEDGSAGQTRQ
jgi:hypothetical protein